VLPIPEAFALLPVVFEVLPPRFAVEEPDPDAVVEEELDPDVLAPDEDAVLPLREPPIVAFIST